MWTSNDSRAQAEDPRSQWPASIATVFARTFRQLDELYRAFTTDGVLVVAVADTDEIESYVHLSVDDAPIFAVIGRHPRCDLSIQADRRVSLRHAVLAAQRVGVGDLRLRFWDLDTGLGLQTEGDGRCDGLVTEAPFYFRIGQYTMFCLATGELAPMPWGDTAEDTLGSFSECVIRDLRRPTRRARPAGPTGREALGSTWLIPGPGVLRTPPRGLRAVTEPAGRLCLSVDAESIEVVVGEFELARGVLIGRYERCALAAHVGGVSRVHLLLVRDAGVTWAVDLATSNGTTIGGVAQRQVSLTQASELVLGKSVGLRWEPNQASCLAEPVRR